MTVENQRQADERIPLLLQIPAAVQFVSVEPMLGPVKLFGFASSTWGIFGRTLDWIIAGGETGPDARPMHPDWTRELRDECHEANVPFFLKQMGEWVPSDEVPSSHAHYNDVRGNGGHVGRGMSTESGLMVRIGKKATGRLLDDKEWNEFPKEVCPNS